MGCLVAVFNCGPIWEAEWADQLKCASLNQKGEEPQCANRLPASVVVSGSSGFSPLGRARREKKTLLRFDESNLSQW